jgi:hypothetical protein
VSELPEFIELEDWEFEETIKEAQQLVHNVATQQRLSLDQANRTRTDPPHLGWRDRPPGNDAVPARGTFSLPSQPSGLVAWIILAVGLGGFVCGTALIGLSLFKQQPTLWQLGLPLALLGQVAVLFVVVWQLDVVWHSNRATFVALHAMDEQIRQLRQESKRSQSIDGDDTPMFYRHVAEGASPHVLLEDLKQQIDVLSLQLSRDKHAA